jgi:hypothetical protein
LLALNTSTIARCNLRMGTRTARPSQRSQQQYDKPRCENRRRNRLTSMALYPSDDLALDVSSDRMTLGDTSGVAWWIPRTSTHCRIRSWRACNPLSWECVAWLYQAREQDVYPVIHHQGTGHAVCSCGELSESITLRAPRSHREMDRPLGGAPGGSKIFSRNIAHQPPSLHSALAQQRDNDRTCRIKQAYTGSKAKQRDI